MNRIDHNPPVYPKVRDHGDTQTPWGKLAFRVEVNWRGFGVNWHSELMLKPLL